jgi:hypothetical protein
MQEINGSLISLQLQPQSSRDNSQAMPEAGGITRAVVPEQSTHLANGEHVGDGLAAHVCGDDDVVLLAAVAGSDGLCGRLCDGLGAADHVLGARGALAAVRAVQSLPKKQRYYRNHVGRSWLLNHSLH